MQFKFFINKTSLHLGAKVLLALSIAGIAEFTGGDQSAWGQVNKSDSVYSDGVPSPVTSTVC